MTQNPVDINELTEDQFKSTWIGDMTNVTESAEPMVDIWPYVNLLVNKSIVSEYVFQNNLVESVYSNGDNSFHHVLLPTGDQNIFVVIIVNLIKKTIEGHYILNLNKEYGIQ